MIHHGRAEAGPYTDCLVEATGSNDVDEAVETLDKLFRVGVVARGYDSYAHHSSPITVTIFI